MTEFDLIDVFTRAFRPPPSPRGPGDDCAVLPAARRPTCVTTDALVEDVHFTRAAFSLEDIGHKALAVNLSDLAAMGARPRWFVCALELPGQFGAPELRQLARGMSALARAHGIQLVGGNVTRASKLALTITAAGEAARPLTRRARPGDLLYVSGVLGEARHGLELILRGRAPPAGTRRQRRPVPRVSLGLAAAAWARGAIDVSDGLAQDLGHLCERSGVGAELTLASLPLSRAAIRQVGLTTARAWALAGGEDYELLFAVPEEKAKAVARTAARERIRLSAIGRIVTRRGVRTVDERGRVAPAPRGYDHFR